MPKSTKDLEIKENKSKISKKVTNNKRTTSKKSNETEKVTAKKTKNSKSTPKKSSTNKSANKKVVSTKTNSSKKVKKEKFVATQSEYYDLPYKYDKTVVKLLAQTPTSLFIYWDISDEDKENFKKKYGDNFFETTKPILIVHNDTIGYSFEVEINDFANSWYLQVHDSKCNYRIELERKPIQYSENNDYIYISSSNIIESPNDKVLFNKDQKMVYFKNTKTNQSYEKNVSTLSFIRNMGKVYNIYDVYKSLYGEEAENIYKLNNPSS